MLTLCALPGASWLPPGGRAEVVLLGDGETPPQPTAVVRLLARDPDGRLFCVPRTGGRPGWDLPFVVVDALGAERAIDALTREVFCRPVRTVALGFVRNTVPRGTIYDWPSPVAHFVVHRPAVSARPVVEGAWFDPSDASRHLGERHWWPLVAVEPDAARTMTDELFVAWGLWLHGVDRDRERLAVTATDALVLGMDSPSLRELAGLHRDEQWPELDALVEGAADELAMPALTLASVIRTEMVGRAREVAEGSAPPWRLTSWAWRRFRDIDTEELRLLVALDDEYQRLVDVTGHDDEPAGSGPLRALSDDVRMLALKIVNGDVIS